MSTTTMMIIIATLSLASATGQYSLAPARHACDEDAARWGGRRAVAREDSRGGERGLRLVH